MTQQQRKISHILKRKSREKLLASEDSEAKEDSQSVGKWKLKPTNLPLPHSVLFLYYHPALEGGGGSCPALNSNSNELFPNTREYTSTQK